MQEFEAKKENDTTIATLRTYVPPIYDTTTTTYVIKYFMIMHVLACLLLPLAAAYKEMTGHLCAACGRPCVAHRGWSGRLTSVCRTALRSLSWTCSYILQAVYFWSCIFYITMLLAGRHLLLCWMGALSPYMCKAWTLSKSYETSAWEVDSDSDDNDDDVLNKIYVQIIGLYLE